MTGALRVDPPPPGRSGGTRQRLVRNFIFLSSAAILTKVLTLITSLVVSRVLGPSSVGLLFIAQNFVVLGSLLTDLGLTVLTMRDIVGDPSALSKLVSVTTAVQAAAAFALTGLLVLVAVFSPLPAGAGRLILISLPLLVVLAGNLIYALQAREDMSRVAVARLVAVVINAAGSIALVQSTDSPSGPAIMPWVGFLAADGLILTWLWRRHRFRPTRVSLKECAVLARRSVPFVSNVVLYIIFVVIDTLSLAFFGTAYEVGIYSTVWYVCFSAGGVVLLVTDAAFPEMVRRWHLSASHLRHLTDELVALASRVTLAGTALAVAAAPELVRLGLGQRFTESATVLRVLIWIVPIGGTALIVSFGLLAAGQQRTLVRRRYATVGLAVVGCPLAAQFTGVIGVAGVITGITLLEAILFVMAASRLGILDPFRPWLRQLDYLILPAIGPALIETLVPDRALVLTVAAWLAGTVVAETLRRFPTMRALSAARRFRSLSPEPTLPDPPIFPLS